MDDTSKQALLYGALAGGWVVILYQFAFNGLLFGTSSWSGLFISILLGAVVAAGVFFGVKKMQG